MPFMTGLPGLKTIVYQWSRDWETQSVPEFKPMSRYNLMPSVYFVETGTIITIRMPEY